MNCVICNSILIGKQTKFCSTKCKNQDINNKHNNYLAQQKRGLKRKIELVNIHGGKCENCGYCKNLSALHFHHLDPNQKTNQLDLRKLSNSTWTWCLEESKKCQLLCANCHAEFHNPDYGRFLN